MALSEELFMALLQEGESVSLDFKREQYEFSADNKAKKSEILKDILAFTNSFRRVDAYILIGVAESPDSPPTLIDVKDHLDDAQLQQFVNSKTSDPITFSYKKITIDNLSLAYIHIPLQPRPIYALKDFGIVKKDKVYMRRGSSTTIASPKDIALMGASFHPRTEKPTLQVSILQQGNHYKDKINVSVEKWDFSIEDIPDYPLENWSNGKGQALGMGFSFERNAFNNSDYFREFAQYITFTKRVLPIQLSFVNSNSFSFQDMEMEISFSSLNVEECTKGYVFKKLPPEPQKEKSPIINHIYRHNKLELSPSMYVEDEKVILKVGKIHAKQSWKQPDIFYIYPRDGITRLKIKCYDETLETPIEQTIEIETHISERRSYSFLSYLKENSIEIDQSN